MRGTLGGASAWLSKGGLVIFTDQNQQPAPNPLGVFPRSTLSERKS